MTPTRALIEAAEEVLNIWAMPKPIYLKLQSAISSAKAAEEGVETMYRVDVMDRIGWVMTTYDRFHETEEAASKRTDLAFKSAEPIVSARIVRVETRETVIEVREKKGLWPKRRS